MTNENALNKQDDGSGTAAETPKKRASKSKQPKLTKYVVQKSAINPTGGSISTMIKVGEVVELDNEMAKHYYKLGRLAPYIED